MLTMLARHAVLLTPSISLRSVPLPHYLPKSFPCHRSENSPVSLAVATLPKTRVSNPCVCHTSEPPQGSLILTSQPSNVVWPIPFLFILLRTLAHSSKTQPLCFQSIAHSLPKTWGVGRVESPNLKPSFEIIRQIPRSVSTCSKAPALPHSLPPSSLRTLCPPCPLRKSFFFFEPSTIDCRPLHPATANWLSSIPSDKIASPLSQRAQTRRAR